MPKLLTLVLLTALCCPAAARAQADRPIVAVFDIETKRVKLNRGLLDLLADQLATGLAASGRYQVVPRDQLKQRLVSEKKKSFAGCYDQSCQIELGRELAAQKTLATRIGRIGKRCTVTASLYDLRTAASENAARVKGGCSEEALLGSIEQVVTKLNRGRPVERSPVATSGSAKRDTLSRADIKRVIHSRYTMIKYCYERYLKRNPTLAGTVTLNFKVDPSGKVVQARVKQSTIQDPAVGQCIVGVARRWRFPETTSGSGATISYPFIFKPTR